MGKPLNRAGNREPQLCRHGPGAPNLIRPPAVVCSGYLADRIKSAVAPCQRIACSSFVGRCQTSAHIALDQRFLSEF